MIFRAPTGFAPSALSAFTQIALGAAWFIPVLGLLAAEPAWQDEFNQPVNSGPAMARWSYDLGAGGWGNAELETYTNARENSFIADDADATDGKVLVIRAVKTAQGGYTSARLKSVGKFATQYGRVEARMKLPRGQGFWPAFWMLGENIGIVGWPECGEIDIMEVLGHQTGILYGTLHGPGSGGGYSKGSSLTLPAGGSLSDAYHLFAIEWTPDRVDWWLDETKYFSAGKPDLASGNRWVLNNSPFHLLLNFAVGGTWPGNPDGTTVFPAEFRIDYVRYYPRLPHSSLWPSTTTP